MLKKLKTEAEHIRLSEAQKAAMKAAIFGAASPIVPTRSPYVFLSIFSQQTRMVLAGLMLFVLVGSGTASAAQGALPGDLLYPVKVSINERVEQALAPTASAKAEVAVKLAERRVEEAQALAARGELAATVAEELAADFDVHAAEAEQLAVEVEEENPGVAERVKAKLATSLSMNGAILKKLGQDSKNKDNERESDALSARVIARAEGPAKVALQARSFAADVSLKSAAPTLMLATSAEDPTNASNTQEATSLSVSADAAAPAAPVEKDYKAERRAAAAQEKAAEALSDAKRAFERFDHKDATTTASVEGELKAADTHMAAGASFLGQGEYALAREEFAAALKISIRLEALLKADRRFNSGILKALLNN